VIAETDDGALALAEPSTEGRLAAALARHGEGVAGRYVLLGLDMAAIADRAAVAGVALSRPTVGPFGREVLVLGRGTIATGGVGTDQGIAAGANLDAGGMRSFARSGPFMILVEGPAVPSRP
jgi:hypothetical protein